MTRARIELGAAGEASVARWYRRNGYRILARNWRCREGELDIVALRGSELIFCEVKTRSSDAYGTPAEAVTRVKRERIRTVAMRWIEANGTARGCAIRFDVAAVTPGSIEVIEGAF